MQSMGGAPPAGGGDLQQFSRQLQQSIMVETVMMNLSDRAFQICITGKPGESLTGKEAACIHATVNKYLDTQAFMAGRLAKKMQQSQQPQF